MLGLSTATFVLITLALILAVYLAWSIGANDMANSMGTSVGAKVLTPKQAVLIGAFLDALGAILVGSHVADTVKSGIVDTMSMDTELIVLGFLASLLASCLWITAATWKGLPVSTTHSIVGAVVGFGLMAKGGTAIDWMKLLEISISWVLSPVLGAIIAFFVFKLIIKVIFERKDPERATKIFTPFGLFFTFFMIIAASFLSTPLGKRFGVGDDVLLATIISAVLAVVISTVTYFIFIRPTFIKAAKDRGVYQRVEKIFGGLHVITACYVAFAHGANDVANAIGPIAGVMEVLTEGYLSASAEIPMNLLIIGGLGIALGGLTWGYKVMRTIGFKITKLTNTRGFSAEFATATTVLFCSKLGLPISTTHTIVGAVIGVGLARGVSAVDLRIVGEIVISWVVTIPIAALTTAAIFFIGNTFIL